jgi:hypothetical protein
VPPLSPAPARIITREDMSGFGPSLAVGNCWVCSNRFTFDPDDVAGVRIARGKPADPDDNETPGKWQPVCYRCAKNVAEDRLAQGLPDFWDGHWGTPRARRARP